LKLEVLTSREFPHKYNQALVDYLNIFLQ
jgi:hypothetical protein